MTPRLTRLQRRRASPAAATAVAIALVVGIASALAQVTPAAAPPRPTVAAPVPPTAPATTPVRSEEGVRWQKLKPAQREALKPLQQEWSGIDAPRKQKWLDLAERMPSMPADERARVQTRMSEWARLTPGERGQARLRFQEAKQIPASDRVMRWEAYQALSPEQKNALAARAVPTRPAPASAGSDPSMRRPAGLGRTEPSERREAAQVKSNIVTSPAYPRTPRQIAPTVVQAVPGATTTLITRRPAPPPHQQVGLPKIAATPEFVNKSTLLPQRGAQGAGMRAVPPAPAASTSARP
jgi:hypothetical protein